MKIKPLWMLYYYLVCFFYNYPHAHFPVLSLKTDFLNDKDN